jgi:hypothetical protein
LGTFRGNGTEARLELESEKRFRFLICYFNSGDQQCLQHQFLAVIRETFTPMLIENLTPSWPPRVESGGRANLDDRTVGATKQSAGHITLMLRRRTGSIYGISLVLPDNLLDKALAAIKANKEITLRQVGELEIN